MRLLKKIFPIAILAVMLSCAYVAMAQEQANCTVTAYFTVKDIPTAMEGDVVLSLYDKSETVLLSEKVYPYTRGTGWFCITFDVPQYEIGEKFVLKLKSGAEAIKFNSVTAPRHVLETYSYNDGGELRYQTAFYMELEPVWYKQAKINVPGVEQKLFYHSIIGNEIYVTTDLLGRLGINCNTDFSAQKPSFTLSSEGGQYSAQFYLNDIYASFGGKGENLDIPSFAVDGLPYVPLFKVAEYFGCGCEVVSDGEYTTEINVNLSKYSDSYRKSSYVNSLNVDSRTDYLIWVSKKDFAVSVYTGRQGNWHLVNTFPCSIGAPKTPTIEGSFEYYQYQTKWQYNGYYCGPIMRFKGGYALHSTLIRNDGTPYDGRLGMKISHGCVRMRPADISWMASTIPLNTRVLVTA